MAEEIVTRCALAIHGKLSVDYQVCSSSTLYILVYCDVDGVLIYFPLINSKLLFNKLFLTNERK